MRAITLFAAALSLYLLFGSAAAGAQTTGGSFGGGDFSSGSAGSSGGSSSSSDHDSGLSLVIYLVIEIVVSPWIPWPLKVVLVGLIVSIGVAVAIVRRVRRKRRE